MSGYESSSRDPRTQISLASGVRTLPRNNPHHSLVFKQQVKLFNPDTDLIPMRCTTEPEASSESTDVPRNNRDASQHRQLFDPRKHNPVSFSGAQARKQVPKSSGDYVLSLPFPSTPTRSFRQISPFCLARQIDPPHHLRFLITTSLHDEPKTNAFSNQFKKLYRDISHLKTKLLADSGEPQDENVLSLMVAHQQEPTKQRN
jgi:hypothetical protein